MQKFQRKSFSSQQIIGIEVNKPRNEICCRKKRERKKWCSMKEGKVFFSRVGGKRSHKFSMALLFFCCCCCFCVVSVHFALSVKLVYFISLLSAHWKLGAKWAQQQQHCTRWQEAMMGMWRLEKERNRDESNAHSYANLYGGFAFFRSLSFFFFFFFLLFCMMPLKWNMLQKNIHLAQNAKGTSKATISNRYRMKNVQQCACCLHVLHLKWFVLCYVHMANVSIGKMTKINVEKKYRRPNIWIEITINKFCLWVLPITASTFMLFSISF